jgi:hypothetical protein
VALVRALELHFARASEFETLCCCFFCLQFHEKDSDSAHPIWEGTQLPKAAAQLKMSPQPNSTDGLPSSARIARF